MISNAQNNEQDFRGLSTDEKPIGMFNNEPIKNGSTYYEIDTGEIYMYDKTNETWHLQ